jgi:hypothetical protein
MAHNTLINDNYAGKFLNVFTDKIGADVEVWLLNNLMVGAGDLNKPAQGRFDGNRLVARGDLIDMGDTAAVDQPIATARRNPPAGAGAGSGLAAGCGIPFSGGHAQDASEQCAGTGGVSISMLAATRRSWPNGWIIDAGHGRQIAGRRFSFFVIFSG